MIFKVDFEKAFDSVRWDYPDNILDKFGFGHRWRSWIQGCLNFAKGSILVNGSPTSEFKFHKGLKGIRIDGSMSLSRLLYADDAVFIGKWEESNISTLANVLNCFSMASGLKINLHKSKLMGIGILHNDVIRSASLIGCKVLSAPFSYLGVKLKTLSIWGRFALTKAVLSFIPLYQMSMYRVPMGVLNRLESTRRDFFNGAENKERKLSLIAWKKNLSLKSKGGLGISSLFAQNRALMLKWIWRFMSNDSSLWSRFIKAMFGAQGALVDTVSFHWCSNWLDIIREFQSMSRQSLNLLSHAKLKVGDGTNTSFWNDVWLAESPLNLCYPRLFTLEDDKLVSVSDKLQAPSLSDSFQRPPRGGIEDSQLTSLAQDLAVVVLSSKKDRRVWSLNFSGLFSVKSARAFIDNFFLPRVGAPTRWIFLLLSVPFVVSLGSQALIFYLIVMWLVISWAKSLVGGN
uniref:Reverse transcriptase domain-containing protein n=1 Tax=Tanacetum cinerariifolium TaxID=118510 RepID=A0A699I1P5_TANCI|nr:hypothetical protein [Tanacetum cinerariifolium]